MITTAELLSIKKEFTEHPETFAEFLNHQITILETSRKMPKYNLKAALKALESFAKKARQQSNNVECVGKCYSLKDAKYMTDTHMVIKFPADYPYNYMEVTKSDNPEEAKYLSGEAFKRVFSDNGTTYKKIVLNRNQFEASLKTAKQVSKVRAVRLDDAPASGIYCHVYPLKDIKLLFKVLDEVVIKLPDEHTESPWTPARFSNRDGSITGLMCPMRVNPGEHDVTIIYQATNGCPNKGL